MIRFGLRGIPSVDKLAQALSETGLPHPTVVATIRRELDALRELGIIPAIVHMLPTCQIAAAPRSNPTEYFII